MTTIVIRRAAVEDAPALSAFAARAFSDAFAADNSPDDLAAYIAESFSPERQAAEIADSAGMVLLAEAPSGGSTGEGRPTLVGYAHLGAGPAPPQVTGPAPLELKRIYVDRARQGQGVAQALMDAAARSAVERGARTLWLGVWERNPRAIAFYRKCGFERVGDQVFMLGADRQNDWLLARPLEEPAERSSTG